MISCNIFEYKRAKNLNYIISLIFRLKKNIDKFDQFFSYVSHNLKKYNFLNHVDINVLKYYHLLTKIQLIINYYPIYKHVK